MSSVERTVEEIKLLIAGGDLSDSMHLRHLHKAVTQEFKALNDNLDQCRKLVENGSVQSARELNSSFEPSLTETAELLDFLRTSDFFAVCKEYGLEPPLFPDGQLLMQLKAPFSSGEKRLQALFQEYRKIARTGTMLQRINLLREIVKKIPQSSRWRNDLIAAERSRCQEIERELEQLSGKPDRCHALELLMRELMDPEWKFVPPAELVTSVREQLRPLQQEKVDNDVESRLQQLQDCWMERDTDRLEEEFKKWHLFSANPMIRLTDEQKQTIRDIAAFLKANAEAKEKEQIFQELICKIERQLADNVPFSEVIGNYNQLQLMDCQIPPALADRLQNLEEENSRSEHFRNVRLCILCICGAVLLLAGVAFAVHFSQHYLAVKRNCSNMQALLDKQSFDEVHDIFVELSESSPKIAAAPQIIHLHTQAMSEKERIAGEEKQAEESFIRCIRQIELLAREDVLDNAAAVDKAFAAARKIHQLHPQKKELLDKFGSLETRVAQRRTELKKQRENAFLDSCRRTYAEFDKLIRQIRQVPQIMPEEQDVKVSLLKKKFQENADASPYVPVHIKKQETKKFQALEEKYRATWMEERAFRQINSPNSLSYYLTDLENVGYDYPVLVQKFSKVARFSKEWQREFENYSGFIPEALADVQSMDTFKDGFLRRDMEKILPRLTRSAEFSGFFSELMKQKDLKELIFADKDGKSFYFYIADPMRVENLRRPARTNITFTAIPVRQEKNRRFILTYNKKNKEMPFELKSAHADLPYKLPAAFARLDGRKEVSAKDIGSPWPGMELVTRFSALNNDGPGLNTNLQEALKFILADDRIKNIYLKEMLVNCFLKELIATSPVLYPELDSILQQLQAIQDGRKGSNWRAPQASADYEQDRAQLEEIWNRMDIARLLEAGKLRGDFICSFHARRLTPLGIILRGDRTAGGKEDLRRIRIHYFAGCSQPREGMIMGQDKLLTVPREVWKGVLPMDGKWDRLLFHGQVIWGYGDGKSSREFVREWQNRARQLNVNLSVRPSILPEDFEL